MASSKGGGRRRRAAGLKWIVPRHKSQPRGSYNAEEKAIETRERRAGKREIRDQLRDMG